MLMCITVYITILSFVLNDWGKPQNKETVNMAFFFFFFFTLVMPVCFY